MHNIGVSEIIIIVVGLIIAVAVLKFLKGLFRLGCLAVIVIAAAYFILQLFS